MYPLQAIAALAVLAFYAAAGLAYHLIFYGEVDWAAAFTYVAMAFWPFLLAWEILKVLAVVALVVLVGLGLYWLIRDIGRRLGGRRGGEGL